MLKTSLVSRPNEKLLIASETGMCKKTGFGGAKISSEELTTLDNNLCGDIVALFSCLEGSFAMTLLSLLQCYVQSVIFQAEPMFGVDLLEPITKLVGNGKGST